VPAVRGPERAEVDRVVAGHGYRTLARRKPRERRGVDVAPVALRRVHRPEGDPQAVRRDRGLDGIGPGDEPRLAGGQLDREDAALRHAHQRRPRRVLGEDDLLPVRREVGCEATLGHAADGFPERTHHLGRLLLEAALDHPRQPRRARVGQRARVLAQDRGHRLGGGLALERSPPRQHLVHDAAQREDVRPRVGHVPAHLLGRHVAHRPEHGARVRGPRERRRARVRPGARRRRALLPGEAEVEDLHPPVVRQEQVLGLEVAVDDPLVVRGGKTPRHLRGVLRDRAHRERAAVEPRVQGLPFEQLRDRTLTATSRPSFVSVARYTSPIPPAPRGAVIR
jgi:hypothetical protein